MMRPEMGRIYARGGDSGAAPSAPEAVSAVGAGVEHYAAYGSTADIRPLRRQTHDFRPTVSFDIADDIAVNAGMLFGLTEASDKLQFRVVLAKAL